MPVEISKSKFKAKALELFRQVEATGDTVVVTDHGKPTIEIRPYRSTQPSALEILKDSVVEFVDPMEPVGENDWDAVG